MPCGGSMPGTMTAAGIDMRLASSGAPGGARRQAFMTAGPTGGHRPAERKEEVGRYMDMAFEAGIR